MAGHAHLPQKSFNCISIQNASVFRGSQATIWNPLFRYENEMKDYEDALVAECCVRNNVDIIVTRNKKDFAHSPVPALTPREFIEAYKPENVSYDMVDFV